MSIQRELPTEFEIAVPIGETADFTQFLGYDVIESGGDDTADYFTLRRRND